MCLCSEQTAGRQRESGSSSGELLAAGGGQPVPEHQEHLSFTVVSQPQCHHAAFHPLVIQGHIPATDPHESQSPLALFLRKLIMQKSLEKAKNRLEISAFSAVPVLYLGDYL